MAIYHCELASRSVWFFVSEGLVKFGQRELVLGLECLGGEDELSVPADAIPLIKTVYHLASQGHLVGPEGRTQMGPDVIFGRKDVSGFLYVPLVEPVVPAPDDALLVIPLLGDEFRVREAHGNLRVLAQFGYHARYFPFPPWFDRSRRALLRWDSFQSSLLSVTGGLFRWGIRVLKIDRRVVLLLDVKEKKSMAYLRPDIPVALRTGLDARADSCLVWSSGQKEPTAINIEGRAAEQMAGCFFLALNDPEESPDRGELREDGFVFFLQKQSYAQLLECLQNGRDVELPAQGLSLSVIWTDSGKDSP